jgi:hypothetical protein
MDAGGGLVVLTRSDAGSTGLQPAKTKAMIVSKKKTFFMIHISGSIRYDEFILCP